MNKQFSALGKHLFTVASVVFLSLVSFAMSSCANLDDVSFFTSISGTVYDATTLGPLKGVSVTLTPSSNTQYTKEDGTFLFENVDIQKYTVQFQKDGYQTDRKNVTTIVDEETHIEVALKKIEQ